MQKLYSKISQSSFFQEIKQFAFFALLFLLLALGFAYFSYSSKFSIDAFDLSVNAAESVSQHDAVAVYSISDCINISSLANQIGITESALKQGYIASGPQPSMMMQTATPSECDAKLV